MGARGPQPKPTALKIAQGNPGKRRLNDDEPAPPAGNVAPPPWLVGRALEVWKRIAPVAIAMGTVTTADAETFARYCDAFGQWIELREWMRTNVPGGNLTYLKKDTEGNIQYVGELPQAMQLNRLHKTCLIYEREFGLTAASRTRIKIEKGGVVTPVGGGARAFRDEFLGPFTIKTA